MLQVELLQTIVEFISREGELRDRASVIAWCHFRVVVIRDVNKAVPKVPLISPSAIQRSARFVSRKLQRRFRFWRDVMVKRCAVSDENGHDFSRSAIKAQRCSQIVHAQRRGQLFLRWEFKDDI